ncbi:MAG TPA: helix-turn-helix domain-containing protein [Ktedonobacteraceae bacterium]|nr:helix-turn-helix domain-containing protein [Ktedonobacteraceae bacterium]
MSGKNGGIHASTPGDSAPDSRRAVSNHQRPARAQIVLLAGEQRLRVSAIAPIVREVTQTVRNWLKRWMAEGIEGLKDRPMPGPPPKITGA